MEQVWGADHAVWGCVRCCFGLLFEVLLTARALISQTIESHRGSSRRRGFGVLFACEVLAQVLRSGAVGAAVLRAGAV